MKCCKIRITLQEVIIIFGIDYLRKHFTHNQRYIIVAVLSMFLPFYMCAAVLLFLLVRLLLNGDIQEAYRQIPESKFILFFCGLSFVVSLLYKNYIGAACSIGILAMLSFILFYRIHISDKLFDFITDLIIVLSIFAAIYGLIEYMNILNSLDIQYFEIRIFNKPKYRINSVFFNANYYAMMIEFFVCLCFYKILKITNFKEQYKKFFFYASVILLNLFVLLLTACRTAWPTIAVGILVMLLLNKHYKTCFTILVFTIGLCVYFVFNPTKFPRVDNIIAYFFTRQDIWNIAIQNIKTHPLLGEGPMTYMHIYSLYGGHPTQHAHSIYLDPLLCFGILGLATIAPYVYKHMKNIHQLYKSKKDPALVSLIITFIIMIFVHGVLDYTIFFVQTGFLFLLITHSYTFHESL